MVERKVSFGIDLSAGVAQLRQQLASVEQLSRQSLLSIQHMQERHTMKMAELKKKLSTIDNDANQSSIQAHRRALQAIESEEQRHNLRMQQFIEKGRLARIQATESKGRFDLSGMGHMAQSAGFYRTGQFMRSLSNFGVGSQMSAGGKGGAAMAGGEAAAGAEAGAAAGMAGLAAAALPAAIALGGLLVASKLVEVGFNTLAKTATDVISAVGQIGGARNIQEMLVEGASTERMSAQIAANVTEKLSTADVMMRINEMSGRTEFNPQQIGAMFEAYVAKTGTMTPLANMGMFAPNFATVSKMTPGETGNFLGQLTAQFGLVGDQLQKAALMLWQAGRAGTVELKDTSSVSEALGFARKAGRGNLMEGIASEMGAIQLTHAGLGGKDPAEAVTALKRFQEELENVKKQGAIEAALGGKPIMAQGPGGMPVYRDFKDTLARASLYELEHPGGLKALGFEERGTRVPRGIGEYTAQHVPGFQQATHADKLKMISETLEKFSDSKVIIDEFDGALKKVQDTVDYQFKEAFNKVSVELEGVFLPVLRELVPVLKGLADRIIEHKDEIGAAFRQFVIGLVAVVDMFPSIIAGLAGFMQFLISFLPDAQAKIEDEKITLAARESDLAATKRGDVFPVILGDRDEAIKQFQKDVDASKKNIKMWENIKRVQDLNIDEATKNAAAKTHGLFPSGASDTWSDDTPVAKATAETNKHLSETKSLQQKQLDVLNAIKQNTAPKGPKAPDRSTDGH